MEGWKGVGWREPCLCLWLLCYPWRLVVYSAELEHFSTQFEWTETGFNQTRCQEFQINFFFFKFIGLCQVFAVACGIFFSCGIWDLVSWPGIEPRPPALGAHSISHWITREVPEMPFKKAKYFWKYKEGAGCISLLRGQGAVGPLQR